MLEWVAQNNQDHPRKCAGIKTRQGQEEEEGEEGKDDYAYCGWLPSGGRACAESKGGQIFG